MAREARAEEEERSSAAGIKTSVVLRREGSSRRVSITSLARLKGTGQWGALDGLTRPRAAGYLDRCERQKRK